MKKSKLMLGIGVVVLLLAGIAGILLVISLGTNEYTVRIEEVRPWGCIAWGEDDIRIRALLLPQEFGIKLEEAYKAKIKFVYKGEIGNFIVKERVVKYEVIFDEIWQEAHEKIRNELLVCEKIFSDNKTLMFDFSKSIEKGVSTYTEIVKTTNITNPTPFDVSLALCWHIPDELNNKFLDLYIGIKNDSNVTWKALKVGKTRYDPCILLKGNNTTKLMVKMVMHGSVNMFIDKREYNMTISMLSLAKEKIGDIPTVIEIPIKVIT